MFRIHNKGSQPLLIANGGIPVTYASVNGRVYVSKSQKESYPDIAENPIYSTDEPLSFLSLRDQDIQSKGIFITVPDGRIISGYKVPPNENLEVVIDLSGRRVNLSGARDEEVVQVYQTNDPRQPFIELRAKIRVVP